MTEQQPTSVQVEIVEPSELDPAAEYGRVVHGSTKHDNEAADALGDDTRVATASLVVPASRWAASVTEKVAEVLGEPFSLRTGQDADAILAFIVRQLSALTDVTVGLTAWADAAVKRDELDRGLASMLAYKLGQLGASLRENRDQVRGLTIAEAVRAPALDHDTLVYEVCAALDVNGIVVEQVRVFADQTHWNMAGGIQLVLQPENIEAWSLHRVSDFRGGGDFETLAEWPLFDSFVHPKHIAVLVYDVLAGDEKYAVDRHSAPR